MERKVLSVCITVGFLGLAATALSFLAEAKRIKMSQVLDSDSSSSDCTHPRSPALALGLIAAVVLVMAQVIIDGATGSLSRRRVPYQSESSWMVARFCSGVSWLTFLVAFLLLLRGAVLSDKNGEHAKYLYYGNYSCYVIKPGVFAAAAILSLTTVVLGILSYVTVQSAKNRGDSRSGPSAAGQPGIVMGQPQFPQQRSQDPVLE
ncbi:protein VASCULATURE COMPLEXITY AND CONNECTIVITY-like [Apium graveolens]|uniref:protein VASCULATURE COMPLEXITY AND CONNECTIVITY-like n=1 Tax=Apium graveolens TaxID=4045 RepID=UPI003D7A62C1